MKVDKKQLKRATALLLEALVKLRVIPLLTHLLGSQRKLQCSKGYKVPRARWSGLETASLSDIVGKEASCAYNEILSITNREIAFRDTGCFESRGRKEFRRFCKSNSILESRLRDLFSDEGFRNHTTLLDSKGWDLQCVDLWIDWPVNDNVPLESQIFHVDNDSKNVVKILIYLTDVRNPEDGSFVYTASSDKRTILGLFFIWHEFFFLKAGGSNASGRLSDEAVKRFFRWSIVKVTGRIGTTIFANTKGIHKGMIPQSHRAIAVATYISD